MPRRDILIDGKIRNHIVLETKKDVDDFLKNHEFRFILSKPFNDSISKNIKIMVWDNNITWCNVYDDNSGKTNFVIVNN